MKKHCAFKFAFIVFDSSGAEASEFEAWIGAADWHDPMVKVEPADTVIQIYTSGTTGLPKGVQLTHRGFGFMRLCEHLEPAYEWRDGDVMLTVMPVFHLVGTGLSVQALYNGATVSVLPALDAGQAAAVDRARPADDLRPGADRDPDGAGSPRREGRRLLLAAPGDVRRIGDQLGFAAARA